MSDRPSGQDDRERRVHARYRLLAAAAVDGRIDPEDAADLEAHLLTCEACREDLERMQADHRLLAQPARVPGPDPRVRSVVLDAARGPRVPRVGAPDRPWAAMLAAGLVVAVIGTGILLNLRSPSNPGSGPSPAQSPSITPTPTGGTGTTSRCVSIPAGLSARWHFDSPAEHLTGEPIDFAGDVRFAEGVASSALRLSGPSTAASVRIPPNLDFGSGDFTIALWVRFGATDGEQVLLERYSEDPGEGWTLTKLESGQLRLAVHTDRGAFTVDTAGIDLVAGTWHHVAVHRAGGTFRIFVDGVRSGAGDLDPGVAANLGTALPLLFGRRGDDRVFALEGDLDEVLAWTGRALGSVEIADLWRAGEQGFCEAAAGADYEGTWVAVDCATQGDTVDCGRHGDGSALRLVIGPGEEPAVWFEDEAVAGCESSGSGGRVATGTARFEGAYLWATFDEVDCDAPSASWTNPMQLYKALGDDGIWFDPDGDNWGLVYRRA